MNKSLQVRLAFLALLLTAGIFVRFIDLGTQFSHIDDLGIAKSILDAKAVPMPAHAGAVQFFHHYWEQLTAVPNHWTYAPAEYFLTTLLVTPGHSYRETLFLGRLPSFLFALLSLGMWILFCKKYDRLRTPFVSVGLALLVFSWQNIVYAKLMQSYSIGVFSSTVLFILLWSQLRPGAQSLNSRIGGAIILAILSHTQYQILFMAPAYFGTLFIHDWLRGGQNKRRAFLNLLIPAILFVGMVYPMYIAFIKRQSVTSGLHWNAGPNKEFELILDPTQSPLLQIKTALIFFARNTYIVYGSMIAFMPEKGFLFEILRALFFILFLTGLAHIALSRITRKKLIGLFFLGIAAVWAYLVFRGRLAYSPTRHSMILLPYFAFLTAEGWICILSFLQKGKKPAFLRFATIPLLLAIILPFVFTFSARITERKDAFDEDQIAKTLDQYQVDVVYATNFTQTPALMPSVLKNHNYFDQENMAGPYVDRGKKPFQTVAFISQRDRLSPAVFEGMRFRTRLYCAMNHLPCVNQMGAPQDYKLVYAQEKNSDVEIDPSNRTRNGTNSLFFYILHRA